MKPEGQSQRTGLLQEKARRGRKMFSKKFAGLLSACLAVFSAVAFASIAFAQQDDRPGRIVYPYSAGGSGDILTRLIAQRISDKAGYPMIVENHTGGAGKIGVMAVKAAAPDGKTILLTPASAMVIYPHIYASLEYDPIKDFAPISQAATIEYALAVSKDVPANSLAELIKWVKEKPDRGVYGTTGPGTGQHFLGVKLGREVGLQLTHIGYRGAAPAVNDLIGGHIPMAITTITDFLEHHNRGTIRILATFGEKRSPFVPAVPTAKEQGFNIEGSGSFAMWAPAKTPPNVVQGISRIIQEYARDAEFQKRMLAIGLVATGTTPEELARLQDAETKMWEPIIKASGFRATD
jgi:tripartite-type tricarboxylate transporter receptor subunit TctC